MAQVIFSYTGQLANAANTPEVSLELPDGSLLRTGLDELSAQHGSKWSELVFDESGQVRSTVLVVLDGVQATGDKGSLSLDGVGSVMLMTPIAGG